jgi:hypothetical protein
MGNSGLHMIEIWPVHDEKGEVQLWDMYKDGKWVGSRRLLEWAAAYLKD